VTLLLGLAAVATGGCAAGQPTPATAEGPVLATARLIDVRSIEVGFAEFRETPAGVHIRLRMTNLAPGLHGVHIHAVGLCEPPDFTSARAHFNPAGKKHGARNPEGQHAGDLPNISIAQDGTGTLVTVTREVTLDGKTDRSILREGGTALVVHAGPDDEVTDPIGGSGVRVACGPIVGAPSR
jgi:Cu-Zn family superoxide dismutase